MDTLICQLVPPFLKNSSDEDLVRFGQDFYRSLLKEMGSIQKARVKESADISAEMEWAVDYLTSGAYGDVVPVEVIDRVEKVSRARENLAEFIESVVRPDTEAETVQLRMKASSDRNGFVHAGDMRKRSGFFEDLGSALTDPRAGDRLAASGFANNQAPKKTGPLDWRSPIFDVTHGLKRVDDNGSTRSQALAMLTPEERLEEKVYFDSDMPFLRKNKSPSPRSLRESVLLGAREGIYEANTADPSMTDQAKYAIARMNAKRLARKARENQIHGEYKGLLGTLEEGIPGPKDKLLSTVARGANFARTKGMDFVRGPGKMPLALTAAGLAFYGGSKLRGGGSNAVTVNAHRSINPPLPVAEKSDVEVEKDNPLMSAPTSI